MPRILTEKDNTLRLHDNISNSTIEIYYRTPTTDEFAKYTNTMTKRVRNKIINCTGENRQKNGLKIMTGFREGDFILPVEQNGQTVNKAISSKAGSPNYEPGWKELIGRHASDIVEAVAIHAFEQTSTPEDPDDVETGSDGGDNDPD